MGRGEGSGAGSPGQNIFLVTACCQVSISGDKQRGIRVGRRRGEEGGSAVWQREAVISAVGRNGGYYGSAEESHSSRGAWRRRGKRPNPCCKLSRILHSVPQFPQPCRGLRAPSPGRHNLMGCRILGGAQSCRGGLQRAPRGRKGPHSNAPRGAGASWQQGWCRQKCLHGPTCALHCSLIDLSGGVGNSSPPR